MTIYIMQYFIHSLVNKTKHLSHYLFKTDSIFLSFIVIIFSCFLSIKTAEAGIFSFISDFAGDEVSAEIQNNKPSNNSHNMALLEPAKNIDPNPNKIDDYTPIANGNALVAEIGPQGTISEVYDDFSTEISIYTVREGDTISGIAKLFNVSVNTIMWANDLNRNSTIKEGQILTILPISGIKYTVKKGDTIKSIVLKHKAGIDGASYKDLLDEILNYNDLTVSSILKAGDIIIIPDAEPAISDTPKFSKSIKSSINSKKSYTINTPFYPGYYTRPIDGGRKSQGIHGSNGIDLASSIGTVIHAAASGVVIKSVQDGGWHGGYGNYVVISHKNGTQTLYAHTLKNFVSTGDAVEQGQMIAKIGMTGRTTGPHVHFEVRGAKNPF